MTGDLKKSISAGANQTIRQGRTYRKDKHSELETLRLTRALFGLTCLLFLLGGVFECHLGTREPRMLDFVAELRRNQCVDELLSGGVTVPQSQYRKECAIEIFDDASFTYTSGIPTSQYWKEG